jgi:hypothetical protein
LGEKRLAETFSKLFHPSYFRLLVTNEALLDATTCFFDTEYTPPTDLPL